MKLGLLSSGLKELRTNRRSRNLAVLWLLLGVMLVGVVFFVYTLLRSYQAGEEQQRVEGATEAISTTMHRFLARSLRDMDGLAGSVNDDDVWRDAAKALLRESKAVLRVERRDSRMELVEAVDSAYDSPVFKYTPRFKADTQAIEACVAAAGPGLPVYSKSYFVPLGAGRGVEVVDLCAARQVDGRTVAFSVETIGLSALLESAMSEQLLRDYESAIVEGNDVRVARGGMVQGGGVFRAERVVAVPGMSLRLRVESRRGAPQFQLNFPVGAALTAILLFGVVAAYIVRDFRSRGAQAAAARLRQEKLQSAARVTMVGEVASLISHEINQPLQSLLNWALVAQQFGAQANLPKELNDILDQMAIDAARGAKVVKSVRDFVSRGHVQREAVDMREVLDGIRPIVDGLARDYGAKQIEAEARELPLMVVCDRVMIEQVLLNLVRNALQAMQNNASNVSRQLKVSAQRLGDGRVRVLVSDSGPGVSAELIQRVQASEFRSFQKVSSEGLGLGLSLCRAVLQSHHGTLCCANRNNRRPDVSRRFEGATFAFTLPGAPSSELAQHASQASTDERDYHREHTSTTTPSGLFS